MDSCFFKLHEMAPKLRLKIYTKNFKLIKTKFTTTICLQCLQGKTIVLLKVILDLEDKQRL